MGLPKMPFPDHKTKIVATIGPASEAPGTMEAMVRAGMDVARLNFSHGDFGAHGRVIARLRAAAGAVDRRLAVLADLPGPKMRVGQLAVDPLHLQPGDALTLTTDPVVHEPGGRLSVSFAGLARAVRPGDALFLNDGIIQLEVRAVRGNDVDCAVVVGGELRSRKGLNLPGIDLGIGAFTERDAECLAFALSQGVEFISQSFVESAADVEAVRAAARAHGHRPMIIAKLERSRALDNLDAILDAADGVMVARGDLGVEIPIERIAVVQKWILREANRREKPVITATQMLESMTANRRPTRAEATDVANAILDGTDAVMLSGESAMGQFPVDSVAMLVRIAAAVEPIRPVPASQPEGWDAARRAFAEIAADAGVQPVEGDDLRMLDAIAASVESAVRRLSPALVLVPTIGGASARRLSACRLPAWIVAVCADPRIAQHLQLSYGVLPLDEPAVPDDWRAYARQVLDRHGLAGGMVVLGTGPSPQNPTASNRLEIFTLGPRT
jgi:pyruvate kinase